MSLQLCMVRFMYPFPFFLSDRILESKPSTNAFLRTTTAVTQFNAGVKVCISAVDPCVDHSTKTSIVLKSFTVECKWRQKTESGAEEGAGTLKLLVV